MKYVPPLGGEPDDSYINEDPAIGQEGSVIPAGALEHAQREIVQAIIDAGLLPDDTDLTQLSQAIGIRIQSDVVDADLYVRNTGDTMTGDLAIDTLSPTLRLKETDGDPTFNQSAIAVNDGDLHFQTRDANNATISDDYVMRRDATGAVEHEWHTSGVNRFGIRPDGSFKANGLGDTGDGTVNAKGLFINDQPLEPGDFVLKSGDTMTDNLSIETDDTLLSLKETDGDQAFNQASVALSDGRFQIQSRDDNGTLISSDYTIRRDASGASGHEWSIGGANRFELSSDGTLKASGLNDMGDGTINARDIFINNLPIGTDAFVRRAGDTMTGNLSIENNIPSLRLRELDGSTQNNSWEWAVSSDIFRLRLLDDSGLFISNPYTVSSNANGAMVHRFSSQGNEVVRIDPAGLSVLGQPVLTTMSADFAAPSGFIGLSNGLIIQWGSENVPSTGMTVTFPTAFPNSVFSITAAGQHVSTGQGGLTAATYSLVTTTNFQFYTWTATADPRLAARSARWMAIGN